MSKYFVNLLLRANSSRSRGTGKKCEDFLVEWFKFLQFQSIVVLFMCELLVEGIYNPALTRNTSLRMQPPLSGTLFSCGILLGYQECYRKTPSLSLTLSERKVSFSFFNLLQLCSHRACFAYPI